jgi:hypothetical protein
MRIETINDARILAADYAAWYTRITHAPIDDDLLDEIAHAAASRWWARLTYGAVDPEIISDLYEIVEAVIHLRERTSS